MKTASATEVKRRLGEFMKAAQDEPIKVTSRGRKDVVIISDDEFRYLQAVSKVMESSDQR